MKSALALFALGATSAGWLAIPAGARTERAVCTAGVKTVGGVTERTFCGPAKATVQYGSKTFAFSGGTCEATPQYLTVNIGIVVLGITSKPKPDYFGLDVGRVPGSTAAPAGRDGTYAKNNILAIVHGGKGHLVSTLGLAVTLAGNRTHGTISGTMFGGAGKVTGTFSC